MRTEPKTTATAPRPFAPFGRTELRLVFVMILLGIVLANWLA